MGHLAAEILHCEEKIAAEKLKLQKTITSDKPLHTAKEILVCIRTLERKLAELKARQEKDAG